MLVLAAPLSSAYGASSISVQGSSSAEPAFSSRAAIPTREIPRFGQNSRVPPRESFYRGVAGSENAVRRFWSKSSYLGHV